MKITLLILVFLAVMFNSGMSQSDEKDMPVDRSAGLFNKPGGIEDRAAGTHNASNIGLFFENRGKLYPRRLSQGPSGEYPINSGMHYIYRINPMVGVPGNVIQGRYTTNEEWEAVGGYHNPDFTKIAFSDNPRTWHPELGWPVKDSTGQPVFKSDQDSYCVYNDANNGVKPLGIYVAQTGYAYGVKFARDILFFKFDIWNAGTEDLDSLYFNMYFDCDIGNISGGVPEYNDDKVGIDLSEQLVYFYDDGLSSEWPGGRTGQLGLVYLQTPEIDGVRSGITDFHYNEYNYDTDRDELQYGIFSSDVSMIEPQTLVENFFHPGPAFNNDIHFDDPANLPEGGMDLLANISSGPYVLNRGDTLSFYTAIVAGKSHEQLMESVAAARKIFDSDFEASKPPTTPTLSAVAGDGSVSLYWNDVAEASVDNFSGQRDFEGYRLYKSVNNGVHWDQNDRNVDASVGSDPLPIAEFDIINDIGVDGGLEHSYIDRDVMNEFEYWYTLTAFDRGDSTLESLESPRGSNLEAINVVSASPSSKAIDRNPVSCDQAVHIGSGLSNYSLEVQPVDDESIAGEEYTIGFTYAARTDIGRLKTRVYFEITDSSLTLPEQYQIKFLSPSSVTLINLTTNEEIPPNPRIYVSGIRYNINRGLRAYLIDPDPNAPAEDLPKAGDQISIGFACYVTNSAGDTVMHPRTMLFNKNQTTTNGVIFRLNPPDIIQEILRESGSDPFNIEFEVSTEDEIQDNLYLISVSGNGFGADNRAFISLLIRDSSMVTIDTVDTLYNGDDFSFYGISGTVDFPDDSPPSRGNVFSIRTVIPVPPNIQDGYRMHILGSSIDRQLIKREIQNIRVVPNPYIVGSLYEREYGELRREPLRQIKFINLPGQCTIHIFTVAGDLVKKIEHNATNGTASWDLRAEGNREIAPGIYIYVVKSRDAEYMSRFAVIK